MKYILFSILTLSLFSFTGAKQGYSIGDKAADFSLKNRGWQYGISE